MEIFWFFTADGYQQKWSLKITLVFASSRRRIQAKCKDSVKITEKLFSVY
jgi:hypothetical protein